jgi:hypothetical protein
MTNSIKSSSLSDSKEKSNIEHNDNNIDSVTYHGASSSRFMRFLR